MRRESCVCINVPLNLFCLGEMEGALSFPHGGVKLFLQDVDVRIVRQLEVVDARHHAGEVVV